MSKHELEGKFNPKDFEEKLYEEWEQNGYFKPNMDKTKEPYCIMMPPPNVTGKLHMGHALDDTIQDILIRFKRMQGFNTLWLPGSDHAAISTEMKVVQKLASEGKTKQDLGREKFLEETWDWTHKYGGIIQEQQRKLGCSCDWERNRFTLDEGMSDSVLEQFVKLYGKGLIYKGKRMVNWCPSCNTSISDAEVEFKEEPSHLWHIRYKITGTDDEYIIVATTRPETMLGDTAVAVHPTDERYKDLVGKTCILPIMNKEIPIIADEFVEKEFGTGCVKITPAHDMNDYQAGLRHNLDIIEVFDENFKMGDLVPEYKGMELLEARKLIVEKLKEIGALVKEEDYIHNVAKCERCKNTIEPKISTQWFVDMKKMGKRAADSCRNNEMRFIPKRYEKQYFHWLDNIQDWCISRQLWWGHRIPAYYCEECGEINVAKTAPEKCKKCGSTHLHQDEDTLDTWFSSALWPFSTLGWPNTENEDYKTFYPTNVLVTGFDIITFWVSRMMTQGLEFTNVAPFKDVVIHGLVRDSQGRKMSKTLGNGIDPMDVIEKYGADALRFSVISGTTMGNDIRFMPEKLDQAANFANKIWNAAKFITMNLVDDEKIIKFMQDNYNKETDSYKENSLKVEDKWIISKLNTLIDEVTKNMENYDLGIALDKIYGFIWNEFCDWYIEIVKSRLYSENEEEKVQVCFVLDYVFGVSMKLLHPFMPFLTTKIYRHLVEYNDKELMISKWPKTNNNLHYEKEEKMLESIKEIIVGIRNKRANLNVHPSKKSKLIFVTTEYSKEIEDSKTFIEKLGFANEIEIKQDKTNIPENAISVMANGIECYIPFTDIVDIEEEKKRLESEKEKLEAEVARGEKMLSNPGFINKAPEAKVNEEKAKLAKYKEMLENTIQRLNELKN
ncbi:MAG: valine--tRNA ligase [Clostridia bacterium]|nr:valine--tRNA ligase [Clostridia bacterium]